MFTFCLSVWSYRYRDERIQADLNKLYDTRPTKATEEDGNSNNAVVGSSSSSTPTRSSGSGRGEDGAPYFDLSNSGNVTAVLDKTAMLNCRVKDVGNRTVRHSQS